MVLHTIVLDSEQSLDEIAEAIRKLKPSMPGLSVYRGKSAIRITYTEGKFWAEATATLLNGKLQIDFGIDTLLLYSMYFMMVAAPIAGITILLLNYTGRVHTGGATPFFYMLIVWPGFLFLLFKLVTVPKVQEVAAKIELAVKQAEEEKANTV